MVEEAAIDFGGNEIDQMDLVTDDLLTMIQSLNKDLGTEADPHYEEYRKFRDEINSADIITLDLTEFSRNSIDNLNLSGNDSSVVINLPIGHFILDAIGGLLFKGSWGYDNLNDDNGVEGMEEFSSFIPAEESFDYNDFKTSK